MKRLLLGLLLALLLPASSWGGSGASSAAPYQVPTLQQDLIGNANNYYPGKARGFVFGRAINVQNVRVDLWEGPTLTYVFPTAAQQMRVVSSSAADTSNGTGMQIVHIHYLDGNYAVRSEQITLSGLTPVNTVATNIFRINAVHSVRNGTAGVAAGNMSITNVGGTVTYGYISAGLNTARQAIYTVPIGVTGYITHWQTSSGSAGSHFCQTTLTATTHDGVLWPGTFLVQDEMGTQNNGTSINFPIPIPIPAMTDVKMTAICDKPNSEASVTGAIMGWFE